ncbi:MAG: aspartate aminotransferase family protein [Streptosporangiales bacterium]
MDRADDLSTAAREALPGGNTRTSLFVPPSPPYAVTGGGCAVTDTDGHQVIDCNNNFTSLIHGHASTVVMEAVAATVTRGSAFGLPTPLEVEFAQELRSRVPSAGRWRFTNSGTEAVMMALRLARAATGRDLILRFAGSYHGSSDTVTDPDQPGVSPGAAAESVTVPVADEAAFVEAIERYGDRLACVLLDLMPNRAGLRPVPHDFAQLVAERARAAGALLVLDEVITFRVEVGGLQQRYGLTPDLTVLAKIVGGGFPVGAVGGREEVMDLFDPRRSRCISWGGTFNANPVTMAAGLAALRAYQHEEVARLNELGDGLRDMLKKAGMDVTGAGSLLRVHADEPPEFWWRLYRSGVLVAPNGLMSLSTPMTDEVIDHVYGIVTANA